MKENQLDWPLKPDVLEKLKANVEKRMLIAERKVGVFTKKLEECKEKNQPLPPETCDMKPLEDAKKEWYNAREAALKLAVAAEIASWKPGDQITVFSTGHTRAKLETGLELFDYELAHDKLKREQSSWGRTSYDSLNVAEIEIIEIRPDGKILAKNMYGKSLYMGILVNEDRPVVFYKIVK